MEIDYRLAFVINLALSSLLVIVSLCAMSLPDESGRRWKTKLALMATVIVTLCGPFSEIGLDWERAGSPDVEVTADTRIAAFTQRQTSELEVDASMTSVFVYKKAHAEAESRAGSSYVVYEDTYGDGGLALATYDADAARIYQDATAEDARVEEVSVGYTEKARWLGLTLVREAQRVREVRIHVPEGTLAVEGALSGLEGEEA